MRTGIFLLGIWFMATFAPPRSNMEIFCRLLVIFVVTGVCFIQDLVELTK